MGRAKEQYLMWLEAQARLEDAIYEEAQSRLRMSTLYEDCVRKLQYPLLSFGWRDKEAQLTQHLS